MTKVNTAFSFGYDATYLVAPKDVSTLLEILARSQRVTDRYVGGDDSAVWVTKGVDSYSVNIRQDTHRVVSEAEYEALRDANAAKAKAQEEAEAAEG